MFATIIKTLTFVAKIRSMDIIQFYGDINAKEIQVSSHLHSTFFKLRYINTLKII